ncbi:MAG: terminase large subunit [Oscillospiraceae bacterium]|jgi:phage terminase large subunit-like protein|nr:terminase large subunit [Oscillospiraceae bacterium]
MAGLKKKTYFFSELKAAKAVQFIETFCRHSKGRGDLIRLELWQKAIVSAIFGLVDEHGARYFREVFIMVGRKNGKTLLAAAIMAYFAFVDDEYGAELYCVATKLDQANITFDAFFQMILKDPDLSLSSRKRRSDIYVSVSNTVIKPLPFNAKKADGLNPHLVVCDEIASWRGDGGLKQYEALKSALGSRRQPLVLCISTAGYENEGIFDELTRRSTAFLKGSGKEERLLPFIYEIEDIRKWKNIKELKKANPNMGVSITENFFNDEIAVAVGSLSKKREFLVKYCNKKQTSTSAWLNFEDLKTVKLSYKDFYDTYAVGGVDLSQSIDLTSAAAVIEKNGKLYGFCQFFMPAERFETAITEDGRAYDIFLKKGVLTFSGENHVNYKDVLDWFRMLEDEYKITFLQIGYDKWNANYLVEDLKNDGFRVDDVRQGENLTPVLREFEGLIRDKKFFIAGDNTLLKAQFLDVALRSNFDTRRACMVKAEKNSRIDGAVSIIDAMTVRQKWFGEIGERLKNL